MERNNLTLKNISFLRARDPSILSSNRPHLSEIKANLVQEFYDETQQEQKAENMSVYLRIKNGDNFNHLYEIENNTLISKVPPGSNFLRNIRDGESMKKMYNFSKIFCPQATQAEIFNYVVKPKLLDFINGQNSTLLTYGASGSGKTFTVIGTVEEPGVVPRSLEYLFKTLPLSESPSVKPLPTGEVTLLNDLERKKELFICRTLLNSSWSVSDRSQHLKTYMEMQQRLSTEPAAQLDDYSSVTIGVWVTFAEIYNEHIYDLLQMDPPKGQSRPKLRLGSYNGQAYIKNLTHINVTSGQQAYQILQYGIHNLNYAATKLNDHSSRSHSIFTIKLVQVSKLDGGSCVSYFNFCDLAGSERSKKTNNVGDRLKESNNINSSLLVLGRCISAVRNSQKQPDKRLIPFRESKLTQLFQKALLGEEHISMIVNISSSREMFDESQHVLNFSAIAQEIILERKVEPVQKYKNRFSMLVEAVNESEETEYYKNLIAELQEELEAQKNDYEVNQKINLDYLRQEYDKLLKSKDDQIRELREKIELSVSARYEAKMANMKYKYEKMIEQMQKNVIEISSSDDESEHENEEQKKERKTQLEILTETTMQGVKEYKELLGRYKELEAENLRLRTRIVRLEEELQASKDLSQYLEDKSISSEDDTETDANHLTF